MNVFRALSRSLSIALLPCALMAAPLAAAATLNFDHSPVGVLKQTLPNGGTEQGFKYSVLSGDLYVGGYNNPYYADPANPFDPSQPLFLLDIEGFRDGGVLSIVSETAALFAFSGLDFGALQRDGFGSQNVLISGFRNNLLVGSVTYALRNVSDNHPLSNRTTFGAGILGGRGIDNLQIELSGGGDINGPTFHFGEVDNIQLSDPRIGGVPEPATWAMMIFGFGLVGLSLRKTSRRLSQVTHSLRV